MLSYLKRLRSILRHPGNRGNKLKAVCRAVSGLIRERISRRPKLRKIFGDRVMKIHPRTGYWKSLHYYGDFASYEAAKFLWEVLRPGDSFLDIGANVGYMTVLASSRIGRDGRIMAVEPIS